MNPPSTLTVIWNPIAGFDAAEPEAGAGVLSRRRVRRHGRQRHLSRAVAASPRTPPTRRSTAPTRQAVRAGRVGARGRRSRLRRGRSAAFCPRRAGRGSLSSTTRGRARRTTWARSPARGRSTAAASRRSARPAQLSITAGPDRGDAPLAVTLAPRARLAKPVVRWEVAFGDGKVQQGTGPPPATLSYTYAKDGVYTATFIAYVQPPFDSIGIRHLAQAQVKVGRKTDQLLRLTPPSDRARRPSRPIFAPARPRQRRAGSSSRETGRADPARGSRRASSVIRIGPRALIAPS